MALGTKRWVETARTMKMDRLGARPKVASVRVTRAQLVCPYCDLAIDVECNEAAFPQTDTIKCTFDGCGAVVEVPAESQINRILGIHNGKRRPTTGG